MNFGFKIGITFFNYFKRIYVEFSIGGNITRHDMFLDGALSLQLET